MMVEQPGLHSTVTLTRPLAALVVAAQQADVSGEAGAEG
jgi:hypothetical protein